LGMEGSGDGRGGDVGDEQAGGLKDGGIGKTGLVDDGGVHFHGEMVDVNAEEAVGVGDEIQAGEVAVLGCLEGERRAVDGAADGGLGCGDAAGEEEEKEPRHD